jgi:hypothetical protein
MQDLWLIFFAIGAGFTASGIIATVYRIAGMDPRTTPGKIVRIAIMVFAGPAMLFETAMKGFIDRRWPPVFFWLAAVGIAYWSLALGLFVIQVARTVSA